MSFDFVGVEGKAERVELSWMWDRIEGVGRAGLEKSTSRIWLEARLRVVREGWRVSPLGKRFNWF